jgi:phosphate-selective porin
VSGEGMETDSRVKLAEIGGDVKRIFDRFDQYAKDQERRDVNDAEFRRITHDRLQGHSNRITTLEAARTLAEGVKQGTERTLKVAHVVWAAVTSGGAVTVIAFVLRGLHI